MTTGVTIAYSNNEAMGYRQWCYYVLVGGTTYFYALADTGLGLRIFSSAITPASWTAAAQAATAWTEITTFLKQPNNDHALIGVTNLERNGRTILYATSYTGRVYAFDAATYTWLNNGFPAFSFGGNAHSLRGILPVPSSRANCLAPDGWQKATNSLNPGIAFHVGSPAVQLSLGYTGQAWNLNGAQVIANATYGCVPGKFGPLFVRSCDPGSGWPAFVPLSCSACTAAAGSYCPAGSITGAGVPCRAGSYCAGGAAQP